MSSLERQAHEALDAIMAGPAAVFSISTANEALRSAAIAHLAQAAAVFAELADAGDPDEMERAGLLADSHLVSDAGEWAYEVRQMLDRLANLNPREVFRGYGEGLASGDCAGPKGQRRLVAIAAAVAERFPAIGEVTP